MLKETNVKTTLTLEQLTQSSLMITMPISKFLSYGFVHQKVLTVFQTMNKFHAIKTQVATAISLHHLVKNDWSCSSLVDCFNAIKLALR